MNLWVAFFYYLQSKTTTYITQYYLIIYQYIYH